MPSIIELLANGEISIDNALDHQDPQYKQAIAALGTNEQKLRATLNADEKATFEKITDAQAELENLSSLQCFVYGFKLGTAMTAEAFVRL